MRQRIAALNDAVPNHAMKRRPGVAAVARKLDEMTDMIGRGFGQQLNDDRPHRRLDDRLLPFHLIECQRRLEECRPRWLDEQRRNQIQHVRTIHLRDDSPIIFHPRARARGGLQYRDNIWNRSSREAA